MMAKMYRQQNEILEGAPLDDRPGVPANDVVFGEDEQ
jgi:hypothetical protein